MNKVNTLKEKSLISIIKGTVISVAITLILILLFAVLIRFLNIPESAIFPVNQVIKALSIFIGLLIITKGAKEKGLIKGLLLGLLYFVLNHVIFSILQGSFSVSMSNIYDLLLTTLMGGILGLIAVNIGK